MSKELKEFELGKFKFIAVPRCDVSMEWVEESNYSMFPDDECDMDINKEAAEKTSFKKKD